MDDLINKGPGFDELLANSGHWLMETSSGWMYSNEAVVRAMHAGYTLDQAKAHKSAQIMAYAKRLRDKVIADISAGEMASWPIKRTEAVQFALDGDASKCVMLGMEAYKRGVTLQELIAKVNNNAARFGGAESWIGGTDGKHRDALAKLDTFESVVNYDFSTGWPEV